MTYLYAIFRHLFVYAALFILVIYFVEAQRPLLLDWFLPLPWIGYVALAVSAVIALQFGRSRLFWCCVMLAILLLIGHEKIDLSSEFSRRLPLIVLMILSYLSCVKDSGFSGHNVAITLVKLLVVTVLSWAALTYLPALVQNHLSPIYTFANRLAPALNAIYTPFEWLLVGLALITCLLRFIFVTDNNHAALLLGALLVAIMP